MASGPSSSATQQRNTADSLILDELKNAIDMNCSVCLEVFTDPFLLKCGHTFCKKCTDSFIRCARETAQQHYQYGTPTIACPECRFEMPADGRSLVKNYRLADIVNQFNLLQTDPKDVGATVRAANPPSSPPSRGSIEVLCNSCNEMYDPKHIFCCSWCSSGRQGPFFACGTCCVTEHSQHALTPYKQMTTPEEREIFVNNVMSVLRDASNSLQADFGESVRITPEYQNLKNKIRDSFNFWNPVLNNLRTNPKLTKQAVEDHGNIIDYFLHLCEDTISQVKRIEKKHAVDLIALRATFSDKVDDAFNRFGQSLNTLPSTSGVAAPSGNEFDYPGPNRSRSRRLALARRRMNISNGVMRATIMYPMGHSNNTNAGATSAGRIPPQRSPDSDDDL
jgi:hypothetical protein